MDVHQAFENWWNGFLHKKNSQMDWYTATRLAFIAGYEFCMKINKL